MNKCYNISVRAVLLVVCIAAGFVSSAGEVDESSLPVVDVWTLERPIEGAGMVATEADAVIVGKLISIDHIRFVDDEENRVDGDMDETVGLRLSITEVLTGYVDADEIVMEWNGYHTEEGKSRVAVIRYNGVAFRQVDIGTTYVVAVNQSGANRNYRLYSLGALGTVDEATGSLSKIAESGDFFGEEQKPSAVSHDVKVDAKSVGLFGEEEKPAAVVDTSTLDGLRELLLSSSP
jgi:hypothetical protein